MSEKDVNVHIRCIQYSNTNNNFILCIYAIKLNVFNIHIIIALFFSFSTNHKRTHSSVDSIEFCG